MNLSRERPLMSRLPAATRWALALAAAAALALMIGAFTAPAYSSASTSFDASGASGTATPLTVTRSSATLVGENGTSVLLPVSVPLVVTVSIGLLLWHRRSRGHTGAGPTAWVLVSLFSLFNLLALMTIGVFIVPVTAALIVACALAGEPAARAPIARPPTPVRLPDPPGRRS